MIPRKPPSSSSSSRAIRVGARSGHRRVEVPEHVLQSLLMSPPSQSQSTRKQTKTKTNREKKGIDGFEDDPFPEKTASSERSCSTSSSCSSTSGKDDDYENEPFLYSHQREELEKKRQQEEFEEAIGWGSLRMKSAELEKEKERLTTSEQTLLQECSDLRSLQARISSLTSELRSIETLYPTQTPLVEVVAEAVEELSSALVTRHSSALAQMKKTKSVEYTKEATAELLSELKELCLERDDAVKRIAAVRVWRDQLASAMIRQQVPLDRNVVEQREKMEKEEQEKYTTMAQLKQTFELNSQMITQIAQSGPVQEQVHKASVELSKVIDEKDALTKKVADLWEETEQTRRKLLKEEQRAIDDSRVVRAKQNMSSRHYDDLSKILKELTTQKDELENQLNEVQKETKYITAEFYKREGEAFDGWTPRPSFVNGLDARQDWQKKSEKFLLDQQKYHHHHHHHHHQSNTTQPLQHQKQQKIGHTNSSGSDNTAVSVPPLALHTISSSKTSTAHHSPSPPSSLSPPHQHLSGTTATNTTSSNNNSKTGNLASILEQLNNNFLSPIFSSIGVDTRSLSTTELLETMAKKAVVTQRDVRRTNDEWKKIERLTLGLHAPVKLCSDRVRRGFEETNADTKHEYLMRFMGASTVPSFLREPKPIVNEKWDFAQTEENCFDYLMTLSDMDKKIRIEQRDHYASQQQQQQQRNASHSNKNILSSDIFSPQQQTNTNNSSAESHSRSSSNNNNNNNNNHNQVKLHYETCVLRALVKCSLMNASLDTNNNGVGAGGASTAAAFSTMNDDDNNNEGGGGAMMTSMMNINTSSPGEASLQFPAARKYAYHILHHGNLFKEFSPVIRAALMTFSCSIPLDFIDQPLSLLRASMNRFTFELRNSSNMMTMVNKILAAAGSSGQQQHNNNATLDLISNVFAAANSNVKTNPADNPIFGMLINAFTKEFSSTSSNSTTTTTSEETASTSSYAGGGHLGPIEILQLQHALQLDSSIGNFEQELIKSFVAASSTTTTTSSPATETNRSGTFLSAATGTKNRRGSSLHPHHSQPPSRKTSSQNLHQQQSAKKSFSQQPSTTNTTSSKSNNNKTSNTISSSSTQQHQTRDKQEHHYFFHNAAFDFQAAIGVRPIKDTDHPGLVLRLVIDFYLQRHDVFTRAMEMSLCSVARPLGETSQMIVTEDEIMKAVCSADSALRIESWRCHCVEGCVIHPSLVRAVDSLFGVMHPNNSSSASSNSNTNNNNNTSLLDSSVLLSSSASGGGVTMMMNLAAEQQQQQQQQSSGGTWSNPLLFSSSLSTSMKAPSKFRLRLKPSFVSEVLQRELPCLPMSNRLQAQLQQESHYYYSCNNHQQQQQNGGFYFSSMDSQQQQQQQQSLLSASTTRVYDVNDVVTYFWTRRAEFE